MRRFSDDLHRPVHFQDAAVDEEDGGDNVEERLQGIRTRLVENAQQAVHRFGGMIHGKIELVR